MSGWPRIPNRTSIADNHSIASSFRISDIYRTPIFWMDPAFRIAMYCASTAHARASRGQLASAHPQQQHAHRGQHQYADDQQRDRPRRDPPFGDHGIDALAGVDNADARSGGHGDQPRPADDQAVTVTDPHRARKGRPLPEPRPVASDHGLVMRQPTRG